MIKHYLNLAADSAVRSTVSWTIGFVMGVLVMGNVKRLLRQHLHVQEKIANELDTDTPGGLTDVLEAVERQQPPRRRR